jgi:subtilisin family serine protease
MRELSSFKLFRNSTGYRWSLIFLAVLIFLSGTTLIGPGRDVYSAVNQDPIPPDSEADLVLAVARKQRESGMLKRDEQGDSHFQMMRERVTEEGVLPVIVRLRAAFRPEGELSGPVEVRAQRRVIGDVRGRLLDELVGYDPSSVKSFEYLPFLAVKVNNSGLEALRSSADVIDVEEDLPHRATLAQSIPMIGANSAWAAGYTGSGQAIAILDTGVDKNHPFLAGKVVAEGCYSTTSAGSSTSVCPGGANESTATGAGLPCGVAGDCDHGTHVAGIAAGRGESMSGVARDSNLIAIQVFSRFDNTTSCGGSAPCAMAFTSDIIKGLQRVYELSGTYKIAAANLSLGGGRYTSACDSSNASTKAAIDLLRGAGIATVVASGNESYTNALGSPACVSSAISVGSVSDTTAVVSSFSNSSSLLNLLAPGGGITSAVPGTTFEAWSGTSMATPHVAGAWAILKQKMPTASVTQVLSALTSTGVGVTDSRNSITKPLIKVDAALGVLGSPEPPPTIPAVPTSLRATVASATQINLAWTDTSLNETGFKIYRKLANADSWTLVTTVGQNVTTYQNTGLSSGTTYFYYIVSTNNAGDSDPSAEVSATTLELPTAPTSLKATTVSTTQINLTWTDGSTNESGFRIRRRSTSTGAWTVIASVGQNVTTYQNSGLVAGRTYYYVVTSYNSSGESALSNQVSATTTNTTLPAAPSNLVASAVSPTQVNLSWADNSNNETGFRVSRKTGSTGTWTVIGSVAASSTAVQNTGLAEGTTYSYRLVAYNSAGESTSSNEVTVTTPASLPPAPTALTAVTASGTQINLVWNDNAGNESGFRISRKTGASGVWAVVGTVAANVTVFQNTGLASGVTYYYRLVAWNVAGESPASNEASATTTPAGSGTVPAAPRELQVTALTINQAGLAWIDSSNNETGFQVQRRMGTSGSWATVGTVAAGVTTYLNAGLTSGATYYYRVKALNGATESASSNEALVTMPINSFTSLAINQEVTGSLTRGQSRYYKLYVPAGATQLTVQTTGTGDVDLYIRNSTQPTRSFYTCRSVANSATEKCLISTPVAGDWHILVYGYGNGTSNFTLSGTYQGGAPVRIKVVPEDVRDAAVAVVDPVDPVVNFQPDESVVPVEIPPHP